MAENHPGRIPNATRLPLYLRMTFGTGLLGIALGYYLQIIGRVEMTAFLVFAFAVRGMILGALIWGFELFALNGPNGNRLNGLTPATRFLARIAIYLILGEIGFWIGQAIFAPEDIIDLFQMANGPN
jgi:hypothetical protein